MKLCFLPITTGEGILTGDRVLDLSLQYIKYRRARVKALAVFLLVYLGNSKRKERIRFVLSNSGMVVDEN
jgi:hypothetical protein